MIRKHGVSRNEPVLIVGGGVSAGVVGLLLRCIIATPRTACSAFPLCLEPMLDSHQARVLMDLGYKYLYGAYPPPVSDTHGQTFFSTLKPGWVRHGIVRKWLS